MSTPARIVTSLLTIAIGNSAQITDHHQHLFSPRVAAHASLGVKEITASDLIARLDEAGIQRAVVLSVAYGLANPNKTQFANEYALVRAENDWTAAQVALFPDRLVGFCSVNPLRDYALKEIARCAKDSHLRTGLKLHFGNSDVNVSDPAQLAQLKRVFRAANRNRMALAVHMRANWDHNRPYGTNEARIFLEQLVPEAPDVTIQIAHMAGGGGFDDVETDQASAVFAEAVARNDPRMKNIYFDVSGLELGKWRENADRMVRRMRGLGLARLLYGSDAPVQGNLPKEALERWRRLPLTEDEFRTVESNVAPYLRMRNSAALIPK